ncbi:hypothetical protein BDF22DRAFT_775944 [Syncephalis plumigaleata]|nr:hypothetical protein BDF22DRAFT_775944 [Syncephalis plumigaleata]
MPRCNCRGDAKCYYIEKPCPHTECVPTAPSLQCASPVCGTGCNKGYDCIYAKSSPTEEGCGTAICAPLARNILK